MDEFDVEAMLEVALDRKAKSEYVYSDENNSRHGDEDGEDEDLRRSESRCSPVQPSDGDEDRKEVSVERVERKATRSRSVERRSGRETSKSREHKRRSRSRDRKSRRSRSRSRDRRRRRSKSPARRKRSRSRDRSRRSGSRDRYRDRRARKRSPSEKYLSPEERDQRTVFCMQLAARVRSRDIEDFFAQVGKVKEVRLIMDPRSRRHKGIAYVEFKSLDAIGKAIALTGTRLMGVPIVVQHSQAEKNRLAAQAKAQGQTKGVATSGPLALYVGSLHFNVNEEMLRGIFEPFGSISLIEVSRDHETRRSNGYGFVHFDDAQDAKKAMEQLNGFELAGRAMKVNYSSETNASNNNHHNNHQNQKITLDSEEIERGGIELGARGRLELMARLAEGTGIELPKHARAALSQRNQSHHQPSTSDQPISTQCFFLSNMFDPRTETDPNWAEEIRNDVIDECRKHGGVLHVFVDANSNEGHVYVKSISVPSAVATINALHGRWFAGRMITGSFVPLPHYHNLFPESTAPSKPL